jgi:RNA polymerase sigma-70 factor (ECF subfamily)
MRPEIGNDGRMVPADPLRPLLDAGLEGDDHAVAELVRRTQPAVWRLCTILGSPGEEEDLVQETYLRALGAVGSYAGDAPVLPWLLSIARRACADHVRRRERHRRLLERVRATTTSVHVDPTTPIDDIISALAPDRRDAFVLTQLLGLTYDEAAAVIGCPVGTIRSRVARARRDLFHLLRQADTGS